MYTICFDLNINCLKEYYDNDSTSCTKAWNDIRDLLMKKGFEWQQGGIFFGNEKVDAVTCILAVQEIAENFPWFKACVREVKMFKVDEQTNLMPVLTGE